MPATESVNSGGTGGGYDSISSNNNRQHELPPMSSYIDVLTSPSGVFQQSQPGLLGGLLYRNRLFTDDLIYSFTERCRYTDLGEATAVTFERVQVLQNGQVSTYTFTSQALAEFRCVVITSQLISVEAQQLGNVGLLSGGNHNHNHNHNHHPNSSPGRLPDPPKPLTSHTPLRRRTRQGPPEFVQSHKRPTPRTLPRRFLSSEEITSNPYFKSDSERQAHLGHYSAFLEVDWGKHVLGPVGRWGVVLKSSVEWVLASPQPTLLIWGPSWTAIFNLEYSRLMLGGSSEALGSDIRVTFAPSLESLASVLDEAIDGHTYHAPTRFLALPKDGKMLEYWMTLDYFPIREQNGSIAGVTCILADQTEQVINARRIRSLHELIVQVNGSQTTTEVCKAAAAAMCTNSRDVSSAYVYMVEVPISGLEAEGVQPGSPSLDLMSNQGKVLPLLEAAPSIPLLEVEDGYWKCATEDGSRSSFHDQVDEVLRTMTASHLPDGFPEARKKAQGDGVVDVVVPPIVIIPLSRGDNRLGLVLLVLELNPMLPYDQAYTEYIDTMGNALSARLAAIQSEAERLQALQASAERKARERLLLQRTSDAEHLQQRQEYFIDMISHELRNPLGAIDLTLDNVPQRLRELVLYSPHTAEPLREIVHDIECLNISCAHMRRLIDDVLSLSKLDGDLLQISPRLCQPVQCIREVLLTFRAEFAVEGIQCNLSLGQEYEALEIDEAVLDPARTQQIIINLLSNAIKYTGASETPRIDIVLDASLEAPSWNLEHGSCKSLEHLEQDGHRQLFLSISVTDTGPGMESSALGRLFQRFTQIEPVFSIKAGGSGLGLFICKRLTTLMGGAICAESEPGKGSTFKFFIECRQPLKAGIPDAALPDVSLTESELPRKIGLTPQPMKVQEDAPALETLPKFVLVVEDNKINQRLVVKQLKRAGYIVTTADDGVQAIEQVNKSIWVDPNGVKLDCILMDVEMPNKDGLDSTRELRAMHKAGIMKGWAPIIGVSANVRAGQVAKMMEAGMDGFVGKPFKIAEIIDKMIELAPKKIITTPW